MLMSFNRLCNAMFDVCPSMFDNLEWSGVVECKVEGLVIMWVAFGARTTNNPVKYKILISFCSLFLPVRGEGVELWKFLPGPK